MLQLHSIIYLDFKFPQVVKQSLLCLCSLDLVLVLDCSCTRSSSIYLNMHKLVEFNITPVAVPVVRVARVRNLRLTSSSTNKYRRNVYTHFNNNILPPGLGSKTINVSPRKDFTAKWKEPSKEMLRTYKITDNPCQNSPLISPKNYNNSNNAYLPGQFTHE